MGHTKSACLALVLLVMCSSILCEDSDYYGFDYEFIENLSAAVTGDSYVYIGRDLKLICTLSDSWMEKGYTAENITFYHSQPLNFEDPVSECMDAWTSAINSTAASLYVTNVTLNHSGQYDCRIGGSTCTEGEIVGIADDVYVEYPPHNVTNFKCTVRNWNDGMMCTWEHPVKYLDWKNIAVTMQVATRFSSQKCPHLNKTSCEWKNPSEFTAAPVYWMEFNVTNSKKPELAQKIFKVNTFKSVQPAPVDHLEITELPDRKGCVVLTWRHPKKARDIIFRIRHREGEDEHFTVLANVTRKGITDITEEPLYHSCLYEKCGYKPMTFHEFSVDCYPDGIYSGYWSLPKIKVFTTSQTAPGEGPQITEGSYLSGTCSNRKRSVVVMWNDVKKEEQNGIITDVSILSAETGSIIWKGPSHKYHAKCEIGCHRVALKLLAHNGAGESIVPSELTIPSSEATEVPPSVQDSFSVEMGRDGNITKELHGVWETNISYPHSYTIFWCQRRWPQKDCLGQISWQFVTSSSTYLGIPANITDATEYLYGISVQDLNADSSSEIFWTNCLYDKFASHVPAPNNIELDPRSEEIKVRWGPVPCTYTSNTKVVEYVIKWQKVGNVNESVEKKTVPKSESSYNIEGLQEDTQYLVRVQSKASHQIGGQTEWKRAVTLKKGASDSYFGLAVGAPLAVFFILISFFIWYCNMKHKKVSKDVEKVQELFKSQQPTEIDDRQSSQVSAPALNMTTTTKLAIDDNLDPQISDSSKLLPCPCSQLRNLFHSLKLWNKNPPIMHRPTASFTNICMGDHVITEADSEENVAAQSPIINEAQEGNNNALHVESAMDAIEAETSTNTDSEHSGHEPNVSPYQVLGSNIGFPELPAPLNIESNLESLQGESVSSYIHVDFSSSSDNSQTQLISTSRVEPLHALTNILAMRVEQDDVRLNRSTKTPFHTFHPSNPIDSQVLKKDNCIENCHDDGSRAKSSQVKPKIKEEKLQNSLQDKFLVREAPSGPQQKLHSPTAVTNGITWPKEATDYVHISNLSPSASGKTFVYEPKLLPPVFSDACTSQSSEQSNHPPVSRNVTSPVISQNPFTTSTDVFDRSPIVSNGHSKTSAAIIDSHYLPNTPAVINPLPQPSSVPNDPPYLPNTPSLINPLPQPSSVPNDPPYLPNTPSLINPLPQPSSVPNDPPYLPNTPSLINPLPQPSSVPNDPPYLPNTPSLINPLPQPSSVPNDPPYLPNTPSLISPLPQQSVPNDPPYLPNTPSLINPLLQPSSVPNDPPYLPNTPSVINPLPQQLVPNDPPYLPNTPSLINPLPQQSVPNDPPYLPNTPSVINPLPQQSVLNDPPYLPNKR